MPDPDLHAYAARLGCSSWLLSEFTFSQTLQRMVEVICVEIIYCESCKGLMHICYADSSTEITYRVTMATFIGNMPCLKWNFP